MIPISVVIFTKNEELNIAECIHSVSNFSQIVVVDSKSSDSTKKIAESFDVDFYNFSWNGEYPKKRQWCLDNISYRNDWILFLDADERMTQGLHEELSDFIKKHTATFAAGSISIDYFFAGKRLRFGQIPRKTVLLNIHHAKFPVVDDLAADGMGELEGHYQPFVNGRVRKFSNKITHNDNDPISTWMVRHVNYANWEAHLLNHPAVKFGVEKSKGRFASLFHKLPFRPVSFFLYSYFLKFGFLDGKIGFDYAFAKTWYYWLSAVIAKEKKSNEK
jgi:glycosyltransferase involved in cell wall biosynthesis